MSHAKERNGLIRDYHRMGQLMLQPNAKASRADERLLIRYRELNDDTQRRIRQFADPVLGYTIQELEKFLSQCETHNYILRFSLLTRMLSVPKKQREEAQTLAVKMRWGRRDLNNHIKATMGTRQLAGRRPKRFENPLLLQAAIQAACHSWCRQADSMEKENASAFNQLHSEFKGLYVQITKSILELAQFDEKSVSNKEENVAYSDRPRRVVRRDPIED